MDYILKLNLPSQQEQHHLVTTISDNIFILSHFICPFRISWLMPCIPPSDQWNCLLGTHNKSRLYLTVLLCAAAQWFLLTSLPCHDDGISWHRLHLASWNPRTPREPAEREVAPRLGKHRVRGSQGHSLLVLNVEEKRPITKPVGSEQRQGANPYTCSLGAGIGIAWQLLGGMYR